MTRCAIGIVALLLAGSVRADDDWTTTDTIAELSVQTTLALDWATTLGPRPARCHESNWILGRDPSDLAVSGYMAATMIGHYVVARFLPQPWRRLWQGIVLGVEIAAVTNNLVAGGGLRAQW